MIAAGEDTAHTVVMIPTDIAVTIVGMTTVAMIGATVMSVVDMSVDMTGVMIGRKNVVIVTSVLMIAESETTVTVVLTGMAVVMIARGMGLEAVVETTVAGLATTVSDMIALVTGRVLGLVIPLHLVATATQRLVAKQETVFKDLRRPFKSKVGFNNFFYPAK